LKLVNCPIYTQMRSHSDQTQVPIIAILHVTNVADGEPIQIQLKHCSEHITETLTGLPFVGLQSYYPLGGYGKYCKPVYPTIW